MSSIGSRNTTGGSRRLGLGTGLAHFKAPPSHDIAIHFIHERGKGPNPFPLILTHGYPDSFYRFAKIIPMLTDPQSFGGENARTLST